MAAATATFSNAQNPIVNMAAEAVNYYVKDGDQLELLGNAVKAVTISLGFGLVNTYLTTALNTPNTKFSNFCEGVAGTYCKAEKGTPEFAREKERVGYILYNGAEFMNFPLIYQLVDHCISQHKKKTGKLAYTQDELDEMKKPKLQQLINKAKRATRIVFRETFATFFASFGDVNIEFALEEVAKNLPQVVGAGGTGLTNIVIPNLQQVADSLAKGGPPLTEESAKLLLDALKRLNVSAYTNIENSDTRLKTSEYQQGMLKELVEQCQAVQQDLCKLSSRFASKDGNYKVSNIDAAIAKKCQEKLKIIGFPLRNFQSEFDAKDKFKEHPTGFTGGVASIEHDKALEDASGNEAQRASAELREKYSVHFRNAANYMNATARSLGGVHEGSTLRGNSKLWNGIINTAKSLGISEELMGTWLMAGTCFGPGFNLFRFTAYDVFDNFIWRDPRKPKTVDERTTGQKIADWTRGKFAIVSSVYAGTGPMAVGMGMWDKSVKNGAAADLAQWVEDFAESIGLRKNGFGVQTMNKALYRFAQFAPYLGPREAARNFVDQQSKPMFDTIANAIDMLNGDNKQKQQGHSK